MTAHAAAFEQPEQVSRRLDALPSAGRGGIAWTCSSSTPTRPIGIVTRRVARSPDVVDLVLGGRAAAGPVGWSPRSDRCRPSSVVGLAGPGAAALARRRSLPSRSSASSWRRGPRPTTELRLAPLAAHGLHWSDRRWDRYFAAAHAAADALVDLIATPTGLPSGPPVGTANWHVL